MPREPTAKSTRNAHDSDDGSYDEEQDATRSFAAYTAYIKQGLAKYKEENPGVPSWEAFSRVAVTWFEADRSLDRDGDISKPEPEPEKDDGEKIEKKTKKLSPYMEYMKQGIAKYKKEHPGCAHKEAFSKVANMWTDADENPNKGKPKSDKIKPSPARATTSTVAVGAENSGWREHPSGLFLVGQPWSFPIVEGEKPEKKEKKLSPYMAYMKQGIAKYKEENPTTTHKDAFSNVAAMWNNADENPNKR